MEQVKGYMTVVVEEASGKNKLDEYKWDGNDFDGFIKGVCPYLHIIENYQWSYQCLAHFKTCDLCAVEIRGGPRNVK
eukprot:scaffold650353_cov48-Prasinocladus_malaysianus.AAC.1